MKLLDKKNKIYLLDDENFDFPTLEMMKDDLVAVGGDFHPQRLINAYENKIINIHPSLLPEYGGHGMYGLHVHEKVFADKKDGERGSG